MTLWESRTHDGDRMGIVQWFGTCAATLRIGPPAASCAPATPPTTCRSKRSSAALEGQDLGLDSVQVLTQTIVGELDAALTPLLAAANAELGGGHARVRNRSAFVTVRLDPSTAAAAIAARGGGNIGIAPGAVGRAEPDPGRVPASAACKAEVLDADEAGRVIAESFYHQATPYDPIIKWTESVALHLVDPDGASQLRR